MPKTSLRFEVAPAAYWYPKPYRREMRRASVSSTSIVRVSFSGFVGCGRTSMERKTPVRARFCCVSAIFSAD